MKLKSFKGKSTLMMLMASLLIIEPKPIFGDPLNSKNQTLDEAKNKDEAYHINKVSGDNLYQQKKFYEAIEYHKKAALIMPTAVIYYNIALDYSKMGDNDNAIKNLEKCLRFYPDSPVYGDAYNLLITIKREIAGKSSESQGPLSIFSISFNPGAYGYLEIYNTSSKDVSVLICNPFFIKSPRGKISVNFGGALNFEGGIRNKCAAGDIQDSYTIPKFSKMKIGYSATNEAGEKEKMRTLSDEDIQQSTIYIPIAYRNANEYGVIKFWPVEMSITDK